MKLAEAIVYLLASSGHGMRTEQIAVLPSGGDTSYPNS